MIEHTQGLSLKRSDTGNPLWYVGPGGFEESLGKTYQANELIVFLGLEIATAAMDLKPGATLGLTIHAQAEPSAKRIYRRRAKKEATPCDGTP